MKIVMVFGTFDIIHIGHIFFLTQAKKRGDHLVVLIARDATVERVKGKRPFHTEQQRKKIMEHISLIDRVILGSRNDMYAQIRKVRPDVICLGYDQEVFVSDLKQKLEAFSLKTKIVRLKPYQEKKYKTSIIRKG